jgi:hypothetical protein
MQRGMIRNLERANRRHVRVDRRSRGRDTGRKCCVGLGGHGRWPGKWKDLRLIRAYENERGIDGGAKLCHCVGVQVRPMRERTKTSAHWLTQCKAVTTLLRINQSQSHGSSSMRSFLPQTFTTCHPVHQLKTRYAKLLVVRSI